MAFDDELAMWNENVGLKYNAREYRRLIKQLFGGSGVFPGGMQVVESSPPAMTVKLTDGAALVAATTGNSEGLYYARNVGDILDVEVLPADPTDARWDLAGLWIRDSEHDGGGADNGPLLKVFQIIPGTPAGSPALPTVPDNFLELVKIVVGAGVTDIVNANITPLAPRAPGDYQLPNQTLTWTGHTVDADLDTWTVTAEPGWDMVVRNRVTYGAQPNDAVQWDLALEVWTAAGGTGTKLGSNGFRNLSNNQRMHGIIDCDEWVVPAGTTQTFYLRANYSTSSPTSGFTPSGDNLARIFVKPVGV